MDAAASPIQLRVERRTPAYWRVVVDNPPLNVMGASMVRQFQALMAMMDEDPNLRVVVFDSAVDGFFLNHSDFTAPLDEMLSLPAGPTGLPPWPGMRPT